MAKLTEEMIEAMKKQGICALATASKDGVPNVVPVGMIFVGEDGNIWIVDNYFRKTIANMQENPRAAFYIWDKDGKESWQVKARTAVPTTRRRSRSRTARGRRSLPRTW